MQQLFLSHNAVDVDIVSPLRAALLEARPNLKIHQSSDGAAGPEGGTSWRSWIANALSASDLVIFVIGSEPDSPWCSAELAMALLLGRPILPLRASEQATTNPIINHLQAVPLTQPIGELIGLIERRLGVDHRLAAPIPPDTAPYPGLSPFNENLTALLFGRTVDTARIVDDLSAELADRSRLIMVSGPSGSGKSSLVRAGVIPRLRARGWTITGPTQPRQLATSELPALQRVDWSLVVVDQAEELVALEDAQRQAQELWLRKLLGEGHHALLVVRNEFRDEVGRHLPRPTDHYIPFLERDELREIVREPARLAHVRVPERLVDRLVDETGSGAALPFLAYTLRQLWDERDQEHGELLESSLDARGGVQGLLHARARDALREATGGDRQQEPAVLAVLTLLASPDSNPPTRSPIRVALIPARERAWLDSFVRVGLTTYRTSYAIDDDLGTESAPLGDDVVDAAHEALFSWPPLANAIREQREVNSMRQAVLQAARRWHAGGRSDPTLLVAGDRLRFALSDSIGREDPDLQAFLEASRKHDNDRRLRSRLARAVAVTAAIAIVSAVLAVISAARARDRQAEAETARHETQALRMVAQARALVPSARDEAILAAVAAYHFAANDDTEGALVDVLTAPEGPVRYLSGADLRWDTATPLAPDRVATISRDGTIVVVDLITRASTPLSIPDMNGVGVTLIEALPDGRLAVAGRQRLGGWVVGIVDPATRRASVVSHSSEINALAGSSDAIAFGDVTGGLYEARIAPGAPTATRLIEQLDSEITAVVIASDGASLGVSSLTAVKVYPRLGAETGTVWAAGQELLKTELGAATAEHLAFDPASGDLFGAGSDPTIHRWVRGPGRYGTGELTGPADGPVHALAVDPEGGALYTAGASGRLQRWRLDASGAPIGESLEAHQGDVRRLVVLVPNQPLSADADQAVLWDLRPARTIERPSLLPPGWSTELVRGLVRGDGPLAVITADNRVLVDDGRVLNVPDGIWQGWWRPGGLVVDRRDTSRVRGGVSAWTVGPDGNELLGQDLDADDVSGCTAALAHDEVVEIIDVGGCGGGPRTLQLNRGADGAVRHAAQLALSPDRDRVLIAYDDGTAEVRRTTDGFISHTFTLVGADVATSAQWVDDQTVAVGHDGHGGIEVRHLDPTDPGASLSVTISHTDAVRWLAVDTGRQRLLASGEDGTISVTDLKTGTGVGSPLTASVARTENDVNALSRGLRLVADGSVLMAVQGLHLTSWELDPSRQVELACDAVGRNLTTAEAASLGVGVALGCTTG